MPDRHAKLSPSASSRWLNCTAAPTLEARYDNTASIYAAEGTFAHSLAELCTRYAVGELSDFDYNACLKEMKKDEFYSQEMQDYCEEYATYIKEKYFTLKKTCPDALVDLEVELDLSKYIPESFGTADCVIIAEPEIWVIDFKYGKGVKVEVEGNTQMEIYGLGALEKYGTLYDIKKVNFTIIQPRLGGISESSMETEALRAWGTVRIIPQAKEAFNGPGRFNPSEEACRFCKAAKDCKARAKYFVNLFETNQHEDILSVDEAGALLERAQGMEAWLTDLKAKVEESLLSGIPVNGWKLVAGKSNRKWTDEQAVGLILAPLVGEEKTYKKTLVGIPAAEKLLGAKFEKYLAQYVIKPAGKPTLAPADDKRPEILPAETVINSFDD